MDYYMNFKLNLIRLNHFKFQKIWRYKMEDLTFPNKESKEKFENLMLRRLKLLYGIDVKDMNIINISIGKTSDEPSYRILLVDSSQENECIRVFEIA